MKNYRVEVCVEQYEEALRAYEAGADQIEFCSRLDLDGLSPSPEDLAQLIEELNIPVKPMLRLRGGDFVYRPMEKAKLLIYLQDILEMDFESVVFGALDVKGAIDVELLEDVLRVLDGKKLFFHKAIDYSADIESACRLLSQYEQVSGVLSSGGAATAWEGRITLQRMRSVLGKQQELMPAGKILPDNIERLHAFLDFDSYHGRRIIKY